MSTATPLDRMRENILIPPRSPARHESALALALSRRTSRESNLPVAIAPRLLTET
jgi:hypothetical protein